MLVQVGKWGNSLALRLPKALVTKLGLKEGDELEVAALEGELKLLHDAERQAILDEIRSMRWSLPPGYKFDRDEANAR